MNRITLIATTLLIYALLVGGVAWALFAARSSMVSALDNPQEQAHWEELTGELDRRHQEREEFRTEVGEATNQPIEQKGPKSRSPRPPALELLENHFVACLVTALVGVTLLYAVIWAMFLGAILRPGQRFAEPSEHESPATRA